MSCSSASLLLEGQSESDASSVQSKSDIRFERARLTSARIGRADRAKMQRFEALDYDLGLEMFRKHSGSEDRAVRVLTLTIFAAVGVCTGISAFLIDLSCSGLAAYKFARMNEHIHDGSIAKAYLVLLAFSLGCSLISTALVAFAAPAAAGSGIPEAKVYLNGTRLEKFLQWRTGFVKAVGVVFAVGGGLVVGKEGPLVHIGAVFGAHLAHLPTFTLRRWGGRSMRWVRFQLLSDRSTRDFVSGGAGAGVAGAFGSPVGGICFSMEEASSFWQLSLTWRTYTCTLLTVFMLWTLQALHGPDSSFSMSSWGSGPRPFSFDGLVKYGRFDDQVWFQLWELPLFFVIAIVGGLIGALFCDLNRRISLWRRSNVLHSRSRRVFEVLAIALITSTLHFWTSVFMRRCHATVPNWQCTGLDNQYYCGLGRRDDGTAQAASSFASAPTRGADTDQTNCTYSCPDASFYSRFRCDDGEYDPAATLLLQSSDTVIKALFHNPAAIDTSVLLVFTAVNFFLAVVTYGVSVPSGLFVPSILIGAGYGRLLGEALRTWIPGAGVQPQMYALIGAASMLSGVARITITVTVILYETTDKFYLILPIMFVVLIAKWMADRFNISLYDLHVEQQGCPFVEAEAPRFVRGNVTARNLMRTPPIVLTLDTMTVRTIVSILRSCTHSAFPVVNGTEPQTYVGVVLRSHLTELLGGLCCRSETGEESISAALCGAEISPAIDILDLALANRRATLVALNDALNSIQGQLLDSVLDISVAVNTAAMTVTTTCPGVRCHQLFRLLGLRHLPVLSEERRTKDYGVGSRKEARGGRLVVGVITRRELMADFSNDLI